VHRIETYMSRKNGIPKLLLTKGVFNDAKGVKTIRGNEGRMMDAERPNIIVIQ